MMPRMEKGQQDSDQMIYTGRLKRKPEKKSEHMAEIEKMRYALIMSVKTVSETEVSINMIYISARSTFCTFCRFRRDRDRCGRSWGP